MTEKDPTPHSHEKATPPATARALGERALGMERRKTHIMEMSDGRNLEIYTSGDAMHYPIFFLHGSPGHAQNPIPRAFRLGLLQVRAISYSRPGYGDSDRHEARQVVDEVARIASIADVLGLEKFSIVGRSGGGPSALAAATLLPERVLSTVVLAGPTSPSLTRDTYADTQDWSDGMSPENRRLHGYAQSDPSKLHEEMQALSKKVGINPGYLLDFLAPQLTDSDKRITEDLRALLLRSYADGLSSSDSMGWYDDTVALHDDWGFEVQDITNPLLLWYAENDPFSPPKYGKELRERIPSAQLSISPNVSHFESFALIEHAIAWARNNARHNP